MMPPAAPDRPSHFWLPATAGAASAAVGLGAGQLLAAWLFPASGPLFVVGAAVIDLTPTWLKEAVIHAFAHGDKPFLLICLGVVLVVLAGLAGWAETRRAWVGRIAMLVGGCLGAAAAMTRASATGWAALPSVVAGIVAAIALAVLLGRGRTTGDRLPSAVARRAAIGPDARGAVDRRTFFIWTASAAVLGAAATVGGRALTLAASAATTARAALRLPRPATTAPAVPAGASFAVPGISPIVTSTADFYRIDTALQPPELDPAHWQLEVTGMVTHPFTLNWNDVLALPLEESMTTLTCVSNEVGGNLVGNALWLGYPLRLLLERAGVTGDADMVFSTSSDGFTAATPLSAMTDPGRAAILAVGMNGEPLPFEHGFPARLVVPGLYGYVSATKWVVKLEVTRFADHVSYWTRGGWAEKGPIKLASRIDVPRDGRRIAAGQTAVGGVAWDQHVGISAVEVQVDDAPWQQAELADAISVDTWRQWRYVWNATSGSHHVRVRATNTAGDVQTTASAQPFPSGSTGLHTINVSVG